MSRNGEIEAILSHCCDTVVLGWVKIKVIRLSLQSFLAHHVVRQMFSWRGYYNQNNQNNTDDVDFFLTLPIRGERAMVDEAKLEKLLKRQAIYGDITQAHSVIYESRQHWPILQHCNGCKPNLICWRDYFCILTVSEQGAPGGPTQRLQQWHSRGQ